MDIPSTSSSQKPKRPPKPKPSNPIESALRPFLDSLPSTLLEEISASIDTLLSTSPKRWVAYAPMLLLPSGSFSSPQWTGLISLFSPIQSTDVFTSILSNVSKREGGKPLTHLAVNAGIPLHQMEDESGNENENVLRSPSGLLMLHGDFGPDVKGGPSEKDFKEAFWVSVKQNGREQVWAPRWTMFSRGNVKEKARLLAFHDQESMEGGDESWQVEKVERGGWIAVDLYAGIGYFVFSYVGMGCGRVVGWEINGWSVEGLRRGAVANGWCVRVVKSEEEVEEFGEERIVVFEESNELAARRLEKIRSTGVVKHVNCGFLPTSQPTWKTALDILSEDGWLHLHENVGLADLERRNVEIEEMFQNWLSEKDDRRKVKVEHVEFVKTFAPDVWHCVFDVYISKCNTI